MCDTKDPLPATEESLESAGSGGREAANREQLLLSLISPTDAELEEMRKMPATRSKLYKKDAQEQRKALKEKQKEKEDKRYHPFDELTGMTCPYLWAVNAVIRQHNNATTIYALLWLVHR